MPDNATEKISCYDGAEALQTLPMGKKKDSQSTNRHVSPREAFHYSTVLRDALAEYVNAKLPRPDKSEVIRTALREYLRAEGFWTAKHDAADREEGY